MILEDDFENPNTEWTPKRKFKKESGFENGAYVFSTNEGGQCYWASMQVKKENLPISLDGNYDIELTSVWKKGEMANYGLMLVQDNENYFAFELQNDGTTRVVKCFSGKYVDIPEYRETGIVSSGNDTCIQTVKIRENLFEYYLNDQLIESSDLGYYYLTEVGMRACGRQTVAYEKLVIKEPDE